MCWIGYCIVNSSNSCETKYLALLLIILSGAPTSQNTDFNAFTISDVCNVDNGCSKIQQDL